MVLCTLALRLHKIEFSLNIACTHFCNLHCTTALLLSQPVLKSESEIEELSVKEGVSETGKEVQSSSEWVCVHE